MAYLTWLADVLRGAGLPVREVAGWHTRGHGGFSEPSAGGVLGVLAHHTAGPASGLFPSENIVVNGRPDLAGPLANLGLARDGTWVVIAAGQAWHAGTGSIPWCPANQGNSHLIGIEAESVGTRDDWTAAQRTSYPRGVAALLRYLGLSASRAIGHKEWAPTRKIDPAFWDMNQFRAAVNGWLAGNTAAPEDDMPTAREIADAILDTPITRQGDLLPPGPKTTTTLRNEVAYTTNESYRVANLAGQVAELARLVHDGGVDPAVVQAAVTAALGGGLDITGTAVPKKG